MTGNRLTIEKIIAGGDGLGYIDGKAHFVPQTLPGEVVDIEVIETKKGFNRCQIVKIIEESSERTTPFCPLYNECGGCNLQFTTYDNQIKIKRNMVKDIFLRNGKITLPDFDFFESKSIGYRNRVQIHAVRDISGFKKKKSNEIISVESCPILVDNLNVFLHSNKSYKMKKQTLFSNGEKTFVAGIDKICHADVKDKEIYFNPEGFFQSNLSILPKLIDQINSYVRGSSVMDLYCGVGLFSAFLPSEITEIIAVELDARVEAFISKNIGNRDYKFYPMSLEDYILKGLNKEHKPDTIIVDPPRKGLSDEVRNFLFEVSAKRIIYVSCDPTTMARDISGLIDEGYSLSHFSCFDFYPNTNHIEAFGVLDIE